MLKPTIITTIQQNCMPIRHVITVKDCPNYASLIFSLHIKSPQESKTTHSWGFTAWKKPILSVCMPLNLFSNAQGNIVLLHRLHRIMESIDHCPKPTVVSLGQTHCTKVCQYPAETNSTYSLYLTITIQIIPSIPTA